MNLLYRTLFIVASIFVSTTISAQTIKFTLEIDKDTLGVGEYITVTYTLTGARGDFQAPEFDPLRLVGGPNFSSQISIVNGQMDQTFTYSYIFQPTEMGSFVIPEASVKVEGEVYFSPSANIQVLENKNWDASKSKPTVPKKRKTARDKNFTEI